MFGKGVFTIFLSVVALTTAIDPNKICPLVYDGALLANDATCAGYYTCNGGKATPGTCPTGYYFNKDRQSCRPQSEVKCTNTNDAPCVGVADGIFVPKFGSCEGYFYCKNELGSAGFCPSGLHFNSVNQTCVYKTDSTCSDAGTVIETEDDLKLLCAYVPEGIFFGSPFDCSAWLKCSDGKLLSNECTGYYLNVQTQSCVYKTGYDCPQVDEELSQSVSQPPVACAVKNAVIADEGRCQTYWKCNGTEYVKETCLRGTFFDTKTKVCVVRENAINECDRCEGTANSFVNAYNDNCKGYFSCSNGKKTGQGLCTGDNYFDEKKGGCVKTTKVAYPSCLECSYADAGCPVSSAPGTGL